MLCSLEKWKDILGKPRVGVHAMRDPIFDLALGDVLGTVLLALVVVHFFKVGFVESFVGLLVLATFLHLLFCVDTRITKLLLAQ